MPKKIVILLKRILRLWFIFLIIVILILVFYGYGSDDRRYYIAAIIITSISIAILLLTYIPGLVLRIRLIKLMNQYYRIDDKTIARYFKKNLIKIQNKMYTLAQKQANKSYLIVFLNKHYIFYHMDTIEKFIELYNQGFGDKEMLEQLKEFEVNTRAEVKIILDTLIKLDRLKDRQISVKERRYKQRFENA